MKFPFALLLVLSTVFALPPAVRAAAGADWSEYLGGPERAHYSTLAQITPQNVGQLRVAWEYHTGDTGEVQCNPIIIAGVLYGATAANNVFALDAANGRELWRHEPSGIRSNRSIRGVVHWADGEDRRILFTTDAWLCAIDARTGKPIPTFGTNGRTSLKSGLGARVADKFVISTTPGTVFEDLIVMPLRSPRGPMPRPVSSRHSISATGNSPGRFTPSRRRAKRDMKHGRLTRTATSTSAPPTVGRDVRRPAARHPFCPTGRLRRISGAVIARARISTPTVSSRSTSAPAAGSGIFSLSITTSGIAICRRHRILSASCGGGRKIDAVAQVTKSGHVFVFDRETGAPLFPIQERSFPRSDIPGEETWLTQPVPEKPAAFRGRRSATTTSTPRG
jgi:quinoprotein glucose dehydrogenase